MTTARISILIFVVSLTVFLVWLPSEFTGFQCRFGLFAKEMLWNGPTFFPTIYGEPYPDYPGTSTLLVYLLARLHGSVTTFTAVLPSAIASALILVFTYLIGALQSRKLGICAVLMAMLTYEFVMDSRAVSLDQYTSLVTTICFYLAYSSCILNKTLRLWLVPLMLVAGFAFRGPIGLLVPAAVTGAIYLWLRNFRQFAILAATAILAMSLCMAAYLAMAHSQGGSELVHRIIRSQAFDRLNDRAIPWHFYWLNGLGSYALAYPLALLVAVAVLRRRLSSEPRYRLLGCLAVWSLVLMVGLSFPAAKKMRYLLPAVPAFSLIAASLFAWDDLPGRLRGVKNAITASLLWLPAGLLVATIILLFLGDRFGLAVQTSMLVPAVIVLAITATASVTGSHHALRHLGSVTAVAIAAIAFATFIIGVVEPLTSARESSAAFVRELEGVRSQEPGGLVFFRLGPDGEDVKYASLLDHPIAPSFVKSLDDVMRARAGEYIVTSAREFAAMPQEMTAACDVVARGSIGHRDCVALRISEQ